MGAFVKPRDQKKVKLLSVRLAIIGHAKGFIVFKDVRRVLKSYRVNSLHNVSINRALKLL